MALGIDDVETDNMEEDEVMKEKEEPPAELLTVAGMMEMMKEKEDIIIRPSISTLPSPSTQTTPVPIVDLNVTPPPPEIRMADWDVFSGLTRVEERRSSSLSLEPTEIPPSLRAHANSAPPNLATFVPVPFPTDANKAQRWQSTIPAQIPTPQQQTQQQQQQQFLQQPQPHRPQFLSPTRIEPVPSSPSPPLQLPNRKRAPTPGQVPTPTNPYEMVLASFHQPAQQQQHLLSQTAPRPQSQPSATTIIAPQGDQGPACGECGTRRTVQWRSGPMGQTM